MTNPVLVLASASPRRRELLQQLRLPFEQIVSPEQELPPQGSDGEHWAMHSARAKAAAVWRLLQNSPFPPVDRLVIGADTVVCCDSELLGKPAHAEAATAMLMKLSGREHTVCTGVAVLGAGIEHTACEVTRVYMGPLSPRAVAAYVASGEPDDKAGAYAIQGLGGRFVERVEGCYYNVVGLPLARLCALLESAGYDLDLPQDTE